MRDTLAIESALVKALKEVFDPEIPVNVYDLGLIYDIDLQEDGHLKVTMTLTAPNCPMADDLLHEVKSAAEEVEGVSQCEINLVFDPPWSENRMSDEAKLELGLL